MEEVFTSELRHASRGLHHESIRRQFAHIGVRPACGIADAAVEILHADHQRLRHDGIGVFGGREAVQSQEHVAANG